MTLARLRLFGPSAGLSASSAHAISGDLSKLITHSFFNHIFKREQRAHRYASALAGAGAAKPKRPRPNKGRRPSPQQSTWWTMYCTAGAEMIYGDPKSKQGKIFRRRFRCGPPVCFHSLIAQLLSTCRVLLEYSESLG